MAKELGQGRIRGTALYTWLPTGTLASALGDLYTVPFFKRDYRVLECYNSPFMNTKTIITIIQC